MDKSEVSKIKKLKPGEGYELLVEKIFRDLKPEAELKHNDFIFGVNTGIKRQIDVSIKSVIDGKVTLIIVQAKDYKHKADVKVIDEFLSVINDVGAQKGILVCNSGFSKAAKRYAANMKIELHSAHSAMEKRWAHEIRIPVVQTIYHYDFKYDVMFPVTPLEQITLPDPFIFSEDSGITKIQILDFLIRFYNKTPLDFSGELVNHNWIKPNIKTLINNEWRDVEEIQFIYKFKSIYKLLNYYSPTDYRVLKDHINNDLKTTFLDFKGLETLLQSKDWKKLKPNDELLTTLPIEFIDFTYIELEGKAYIAYKYTSKNRLGQQ